MKMNLGNVTLPAFNTNTLLAAPFDLDFTSVMTLDLDFMSVRLWLRLDVSQMLDIDSMSVQL